MIFRRAFLTANPSTHPPINCSLLTAHCSLLTVLSHPALFYKTEIILDTTVIYFLSLPAPLVKPEGMLDRVIHLFFERPWIVGLILWSSQRTGPTMTTYLFILVITQLDWVIHLFFDRPWIAVSSTAMTGLVMDRPVRHSNDRVCF